MTNAYDFNSYLHIERLHQPVGVMSATVKTSHVMGTRPHPRTKAHRPAYAAVANIDGQLVLGARYLCGEASSSIRPLAAIPTGIQACPKCERVASNEPRVFSVYAYYDHQGHVLYVGQTVDLDSRHYGHAHGEKSRRWFHLAEHRAVLSTHPTREGSLAAEAEAITHLRPRFNVRGILRLVEAVA